ncbi:zinc-binding dehydrogenase [Paenibacillus sp. MY03]|jgi:2-desacetyl-2-hydroxyethyl bacteriochlorophyllide A dehydrogenase|uniref:zinc-dependent alcohol dehydrogenase n=1 Tax=Paenibacillus sp. MY03 TaxID=302980 RepID=UPI00211AF638|nr:alcohol dehydrogenase catalytic domain-containing protein [Paenibacillus sp. MY03]
MAETMRALLYEGPRQLELRTMEIPQPGEHEVLVRVHWAGICGSELSGYLGLNSLRKPPLVMGHEFAGVIEQAGTRVEGLQSGDRVTANPLISCGICMDCYSGRANLCPKRSLVGAGRPGAFAEYAVVPAGNIHVLPESVSLDAAALAEPFACAVRIARLAALEPSDSLFIAGAGPIGLFVLRAAQRYGVQHTAVMDLNAERLGIVRAMGGIAVSCDEDLARVTPARGFDKCVDAVGIDATRQQCMGIARPGGRVVFSGLHTADSVVPVNTAIRNELTMLGSFGYNPIDFQIALKWIEESGTGLERWTVHEPLENGKACFDKLLSGPGSVAKILLDLS